MNGLRTIRNQKEHQGMESTNKSNSLLEVALNLEGDIQELPPVDSLELAEYYLNKHKHKLPEINKRLRIEEGVN